jgi:hypothetical protein
LTTGVIRGAIESRIGKSTARLYGLDDGPT